MTVSAEEVRNTIGELSKLVESIPNQIEMIKLEIMLCDREEQDILHKIELENFNAYHGWNLAKDIQITRRKRRELKDNLEDLSRLQESLLSNRTIKQHTQSVEDFTEHKENLRSSRTYTLRVRNDLKNMKKRIVTSKR